MPLKPRKTCRGSNAASSFTQRVATARFGLVCVTLAPGCRQKPRSPYSSSFFRLNGRAWVWGYSFHAQSLWRFAARFGRRMRKAAAPGVKGDRCMMHAQRLVYVIDDDISMRKAIGRLLESEGYSVEMFAGARE